MDTRTKRIVTPRTAGWHKGGAISGAGDISFSLKQVSIAFPLAPGRRLPCTFVDNAPGMLSLPPFYFLGHGDAFDGDLSGPRIEINGK